MQINEIKCKDHYIILSSPLPTTTTDLSIPLCLIWILYHIPQCIVRFGPCHRVHYHLTRVLSLPLSFGCASLLLFLEHPKLFPSSRLLLCPLPTASSTHPPNLLTASSFVGFQVMSPQVICLPGHPTNCCVYLGLSFSPTGLKAL